MPSAFLGIAVLLSISPLSAAEPQHAAPNPVAAKLQELIAEQRFSGAVVVVGRGDGTISYDFVGLRDIDAKLPMTKDTLFRIASMTKPITDTLFRIASMTKPITAIGIMVLVDEGKLAVDDPVEKHLPEFRGQMLVAQRSGDSVVLKKPARPITIRDLLTHTSGLPARPRAGVIEAATKRSLTLAEAVAALSQQPLEFEPDSKWEYCSPGIDTLGRIIEVAAGQPFDAFLQQRIFAPLGMTDTTFYPTEEQGRRLAVPALSVTLNHTATNSLVFRCTDPRYEKILGSGLKTPFAGLGRLPCPHAANHYHETETQCRRVPMANSRSTDPVTA